MFTPTYLYIKEHTETGLRYFGKTVKDPIKYNGSGKYWLRHINQHGKDKINTVWFELFLDRESIVNFATKFSIENNIVDSTLWANLDIETGLSGGARRNNHFKKLNSLPMDNNRRIAISKSQLNNTKRHIPVTIDNVMYPSMRNASKDLGVSEQIIYYWIKIGRAIKHTNFVSDRCSCIKCHKEISTRSLNRHFENH